MKVELEFDVKTALRWLLAALLVWAALGKIANLQEFHANIAAYRLPLPGAWLRMAVTVVPWLELLCGILMIAGTMRRAALLCALVLCVTFVLATGQAWARGLEISCGCFNLDWLGDGKAKHVLESVQFAFARALLLLGVAVCLFRASGPSATPRKG
jgi:uncharacterized membrane protein YphA (DoxX/SURF4 family)